MHTPICDQLGIEFPIFAFSHCRDVVAAVSQAGGFGVLGALGFTADELEIELQWIDDQVGSRPYGVDVVMPSFQEGRTQGDPSEFEAKLGAMIPAKHRDFVQRLLEQHGVPELPEDQKPRELLGWVDATAKSQVHTALTHEKVRLVANALGTPPADVISEVQTSGRLVAALSGSVRHALSHKQAGVDLIIAQGHEGGAHTGEIGSVVLWPEVIDAVSPTPVLAAGGIGTGRQIAAALAMGAEGVWTGSLWLLVEEADLQPAQRESYLRAGSGDTVRSRSFTGKPSALDCLSEEEAMSDDLGTPHLRFERRGPIGWCTIDRPEARNALTASMYFGLRKAVDLVNGDPRLGALVITGVGDVFAPGGEMGGRHDEGSVNVGALMGMDVLPFKAIRHSAAPIVAAVNGICQGGGLMTALLSDVAVASERATFRAPELLRGVADSWFAAVLPVHVGLARARELVLTARRIDAAEAERIGLIAQVVPHEELHEAAEQIARRILDTAPVARAQWKRMVNSGYGWIDEPTMEASIQGDECAEGFRAFVEKRPPSWVPGED